jgi:hypothetical protein
MTIPRLLIDFIREGQVVLFLGSGASKNADHPRSLSPPTGDQLARMIAERFLGEKFYGRSLTQVAELATSESDQFRLQEFVASLFSDFGPADFHKLIPTFLWSGIATTNYDLVLERAYDQVAGKLQQPVIFKKNGERVEDRLKSKDNVIYLKLHGCITSINDEDLPLILTPEQYITHRKNRSRLYEKLQSFAYEFPFLFVGSSLGDQDIRAILLELDELKDAKPRSYMVVPEASPEEVRFWEKRKITTITMSFKDFIVQLDREIRPELRGLAKLSKKYESPIFSRFRTTTPDKVSPSLLAFISRDVEYVDKKYKAAELDPKSFYKGFFVDLSPIVFGYDVRRSVAETIMSEVILADEEERRDTQEFYLIKGHAGSGKTVVLRRLAWEAAVEFNKLCLLMKPASNPNYEPLYELYRLCNERIFLFIDPVVENRDAITHLITRARKDNLPLTIIAAERYNEWNTECEQLDSFVTGTYEVRYLSEKEIDELLVLLNKHKSLGYLENKSLEEQREALSKRAGRQLLVALHEATLGKPFSDIVLDEYKNIASPQAQSLYLTVCILHRLGVATRAGLISRVHGIPFRIFKERLFGPLEFIVFALYQESIKDFVYRSRHPQIAEIVFERVLVNPQERYDEYVRVMNCIDIDYNSDFEAFSGLTNARQLLSLFPDVQMIREIYAIAKRRAPDNVVIMQQEAIFEMNSPERNLDKASALLQKANKLAPKNEHIMHSLSVLAQKRAENAKTAIEKKKYMDESRRIAAAIIAQGSISPHPYHTLISVGIEELSDGLKEQSDEQVIERLIKNLEQQISLSKLRFPDSEFILQAEADFCKRINQNQRALTALKKAFTANRRSPFVASRLAATYEASGDNVNAIAVLRECLEANPSEKYINYRLAMLLMHDERQNWAEIRHHLRRSFTEGDSNYTAQFHFARVLYLDRNINEAMAIFRRIGEAHIDIRIKNEPRCKVVDGENPVLHSGAVHKRESSYCFVIRDRYNDRIFSHKDLSKESEWVGLMPGMRVTFELAFNYRGPVALNIKPESAA